MRKSILSQAFFLFFPALTALSFMGCMTDSGNTVPVNGPNRTLKSGLYDNHDIGLQIVFPTSWEAQLDQAFGNTKVDLVILDAPRNGFRANLTVLHAPHSGPTPMSEVLPLIKHDLLTQTLDLSRYQDSILVLNGKEVGRIDYESSVSGNLYHFQMMVFVNNGRDVVLTLTDRADDFALNLEVQNVFSGVSITPK
jgi:hypothetical protein